MLDDTTAFVTGASQGLGRVIAETFADRGANVVLAARSDGIYETETRIDAPDRTLAVETDVTDEAAVESAIDVTVETFGGLDCLVNNAGIAGPTAPIEEISREEWMRTQEVNTLGPFLCTKHAAEHLRASDRGSVVTISSIGGKRPYPLRTPYGTSKMGVVGFTRAISRELGPEVTANAICPGAVEGDRIRRVFRDRAESLGVDPEAVRQGIVDELPLDEIVPPEEVAEMAAYLAGPNARHVTGQDINVASGGAWY
ncbi:MAG: SDR family NAD(P)-dependent oxidoreductase [Haloarculaceae archaeon]